MAERYTLYTARWIVPVSAPPIRDGALLVDPRGRIAAVGPEAAVPAPEDARRVALGEAALLPGLVNVHAHPELTAFRGLLEDLSFHEWIFTLNRIKRALGGNAPPGPPGATIAPPARLAEDFDAAARWTCVEALRAGITTIAATEDSGAALDALRDAGLRGIVYREVFGPDPAKADLALAGLERAVAEMRSRETDLVRVGVSPHAPYTVSDALFRAVARYALEEGLPLATHTAESAAEWELVVRGGGWFAEGLRRRGIEPAPRGASTIELMDRVGVLETRPLLIHCVDLGPDDIRRIADRGASVAHCPVANARLGHGIAPVVELREAGVPVGLGTDSVASNNRLDLLEEARLAQLFQRARLHSPSALPAADVLRMATLDGARALGLEDRIGSLEPGKDADLCAVSLEPPHVCPVHEPCAAVVHAARGSDVLLTVVRGRELYRAGQAESPELARLRDRLDRAAERLRQALVT